MNGHDEARLDAVAVLALGAMPAAEARELETHMADCPICRREYAELRAGVDMLAVSAEATPAELGGARCDALRARIMDEVRAGAPDTAADSNVVPFRARRFARIMNYVAAAAVLAVAIVSTWNAATLRTQTDNDRQQIALLQAQLDQRDRAVTGARAQMALEQSQLADLIAPGATIYPVSNGMVVRSRGRIIIGLRGLPPLPPGKTYQAWTLARGAKAMTPSSTFVPDATGLALIELPGSAAGVTTVAVSVEPQGGSKAPTSKPTFVRSLS